MVLIHSLRYSIYVLCSGRLTFNEETLHKRFPYLEFLRYVFSRIRTEYGEILRISPNSVRMRENIDQKKLRIWTYFTQ